MLNWYLQSGKDSDVILDSKVILSRNILGYKFINKCTEESKKQILQKIESMISIIGYNLKEIKMQDLDTITKTELVEKGIISDSLAKSKSKYSAVLLSNDENISIMINENNHIVIQVFSSGKSIEETMNYAIEIDKKIEELIPYAFNIKYGFLTNSITDVGTGMRIYVRAHMPGLVHTGNINKMLNIIKRLNMDVESLNQGKGDIFQISNNQTLGVSENEIMQNITTITDKIIEQERLARTYLGKNQIVLENNVYKSYGILKYSKMISLDETMDLLSDVKLGTDMGIIKELNDSKVMKLLLYVKPGNLQKYFNEDMDLETRNIKRSEIINLILEGKI